MSAWVQSWASASQSWAQWMLFWSWQSLVLVAVLSVACRLWRRASSSARHDLWLLGMAAVAVLPLFSAAARVMPYEQSLVESFTPIVRPPIIANVTTDYGAPAAGAIPVFAIGAGFLLAGWCAGAAVCLWRLARSYRRLLLLRRNAVGVRPVPASSGSEIPVGYSPEIQTPQVAGIRHPMILLPIDIDEWAAEDEIRGVLLHECAHLERRDQYVNVLQALLGAVFFFHPAVRYGLRQINVERELACDDIVGSKGVDPGLYSEAILKVAEHSVLVADRHQLAFDSSRKVLERRIRMILNRDVRRSRAVGGRCPAMAPAAMMIGVLTFLLLPHGELIAEVESSVTVPVQPVSAAPLPLPEASRVIPPSPPVVLAAVAVPKPRQVVQEPQQPEPASVSGNVHDPAGARIPGVRVTLTGQGPRQVITNETGSFLFPALEPGTYLLEAFLPGFVAHRQSITVAAGRRHQQDLTLRLAGVHTTVTVTTNKPSTTPGLPSPPLRIGGDVAQPNLIFQPKPVYPPSMRAMGIEGSVEIEAIIGADGTILAPHVISGGIHPDLAAAAMESVKQWRYRPGMLNGQPIEVLTRVTIYFAFQD